MRSCPETDIGHLKHLKSLFPCGPLKKNFRCMDHIRKLDDCSWSVYGKKKCEKSTIRGKFLNLSYAFDSVYS